MVVSEGNVFYAYIHYKPDFTPFYVGKGLLRRANSLKQRNSYYMATVEKYGAENIIIGKFECSREENAFDLERGIIKCLKKAGVKITNFTDGGEGSSGRVQSEETRAKISAAQIGKTFSAETRAKMSAWGLGRTFSTETRAKMSAAQMGNTNCVGRTHSAEARAKISAAQMGNTNSVGRTHSAETRAKMSAWQIGRTFSTETRAKISVAKTGKTCSAETRAKISASLKLRWLNAS